MTTARAVLLSAGLIALAIVGTAWWSTERTAEMNRYQLINAGGGATVRLDRESGELIGCRDDQCRQLTTGESITSPIERSAATMPAPPPGYTLDK